MMICSSATDCCCSRKPGRSAARRTLPVLAAELGGDVVAHREANTGNVPRLGDEPRPSLLQVDLLLKLDGVREVVRCHLRVGFENHVQLRAAACGAR